MYKFLGEGKEVKMKIKIELYEEKLLLLQKLLGVENLDLLLLKTALTHTSYAYEKKVEHNERLEFLGDAVLEIVISTMLFKRYPYKKEGELTKARASLVCEAKLMQKALSLDLGSLLRLGKGERKTGGRNRASVLADAFEACMGVIYLDKGLDVAKQCLNKLFFQDVENVFKEKNCFDFKTQLQEAVYSKTKKTGKNRFGENLTEEINEERIVYQIIEEKGPEHEKKFFVEVLVDGIKKGRGVGKNKKEAEQCAALKALEILGLNDE